MSKKHKIAIIGLKGLPAFGGAATVGERIINQLNNKYSFFVYSSRSHTNEKSGVYKNICYQYVFKSIPLKKLNTLVYYVLSAIHSVLFGKYDLIHLHHRDAVFIIPILRIRYPVILTTHGMVLTKKWNKFKWFFDLQDKFFLGKANIITTVSLKDNRITKKIIKNKKIKYIPNGIDIIEKQYDKKDFLTFAAARIVPDKGCHVLLKALKVMNHQGEVKIIGDYKQMGAYRNELLQLANVLNNVKFLGLIKEKTTLFEIIGSTKLFIYPSEIESMSMMLLEVASLKTPMICARIPENEDILSDDDVLYFEKGNTIDLANKIQWALENYTIMEMKAESAYIRLKNNYLWEDIAKSYNKVYESLIGNNK